MLHTPVTTPSTRNAKALRRQLMNPPNAVPDLGIDLRRALAVNEPAVEGPAVKVDRPPKRIEALPEPTRDCSILPPSPSLNDIISRVARYYGMTRDELMVRKRIPALVWRRDVAIFFCRRTTRKSLPAIAREFGRDHTTVLYAIRKIEDLMNTDADARREIEHVGFALGVFSPV